MKIRKVGGVFGIVLLSLWPAAPSRACYGDKYDGVHFHSGEMDFGTVPRRGRVRGEGDDRPVSPHHSGGDDYNDVCELKGERDTEWERKRDVKRERLAREVKAQERAGRWRKAREVCEQAATALGWNGNLRDHVEVLTQAQNTPHTAGFRRVLRRYLEEIPLEVNKIEGGAKAPLQRIYADPASGFLRGHALYQMASIAYDRADWRMAIALYRRMLREFPKTLKREAALVMIGRCALLPGTPNAAMLAEGRNAVQELEQKFPNSRFRRALLGLKGKIGLVTGDYNTALHCYFTTGDLESVEIVRRNLSERGQSRVGERLLAEYLRRLNRAARYYPYDLAVRSIRRTRDGLTPADALRFSQRLKTELDLVPPYLYYRLYHCDNKPRDFANLARLAATLIAQHPVTRLSPAVRVKLAEVYYQRRQYEKAIRWADLAMQPAVFDRALFVKGASLNKMKRYRAAVEAYETLLRNFPDSPLRHGTREDLAIAYEAAGNPAGALDQYFALDYAGDIAFFLDAKMTSKQIEAYLASRPNRRVYVGIKKGWDDTWKRTPDSAFLLHNVLAYTLGIRYLREGDWRQSANWLRRVPRAAYIAFSEGRKQWETKASPDPLTAIRDLSRLERAVAAGRTETARADALYRYATYYYSHGLLLLYNPILWQQQRMINFDMYWNATHATPQDYADLRTHLYAHDVYAYSKRICLELVRRYPKSPAAPKALYRAATSAFHLANINETWREEDAKRGHLTAEASRLMKRLTQEYPTHALAHTAGKYAKVFGQRSSP